MRSDPLNYVAEQIFGQPPGLCACHSSQRLPNAAVESETVDDLWAWRGVNCGTLRGEAKGTRSAPEPPKMALVVVVAEEATAADDAAEKVADDATDQATSGP